MRPRFFASAREFRAWLARHAARTSELVVGFWKVDTGKPSMTWSESVDEALSFGWIDGVRTRIDDDAYQIRFTPRKLTSDCCTGSPRRNGPRRGLRVSRR